MSKIEVNLSQNILTIHKKNSRNDKKNIEPIQVDLLVYGKDYESKLCATNKKEKNKVFFMKEVDRVSENTSEDEELQTRKDEKNVIIVYSQDGKIRYSYCSKNKAYKKLVKLKYKVLYISLNKRRLKIKVLAYLVNKYKLDIKDCKFYIDEVLYKNCNIKQYKSEISKLKMLKEGNIYTFKFNMEEILKDESIINGAIRFNFKIEENEIDYRIAKFNKKLIENKYYKIPLKYIYVKDFAVHIRRTLAGNLVLVKRKIEPIEESLRFKILENRMFSCIMYHLGKTLNKFRKRKINLFYEKFASKSEEGVLDLCKKCGQSNRTRNYFIIDKESADYNRIKENKCVIPKYSLKYYWLFYNTNYFIASEVPSHLNILRSNNKYFRKATYDKKFVFLQHGIIYMKNLGLNTVFSKGEEGESQYMIVSSQKEKDVVVDMLHYDEEQLLVTGLGMFSNIKYNHINEKSEDYVTIMLTWKPYEEQLYNFEESSYYENVIQIYKILCKYINKDKIIIIGHPKANELLSKTDIKDSLWKNPISKALEKTKLLITDYSSVCYNVFYQRGGVIFYQDDLEKYEKENGHLIPNEDEYIGKRAFNIEELERIIEKTVENGRINLNTIRTKEFEENYKTINEFTDGKNIDRIYEELCKLNLI